jgi:hypothetical protein
MDWDSFGTCRSTYFASFISRYAISSIFKRSDLKKEREVQDGRFEFLQPSLYHLEKTVAGLESFGDTDLEISVQQYARRNCT